jgi:toxin FitB
MILLDTNVLSAMMRRDPPASVIGWLDRQAASSIWTTAITVFEIEYGLRRLPAEKRRTRLEDAFRCALLEDFGGRIVSFDTEAARAAGAISAELEAAGRPVEIRDVQVAGIARARNAVVATRNTQHFEFANRTVDPWSEPDAHPWVVTDVDNPRRHHGRASPSIAGNR